MTRHNIGFLAIDYLLTKFSNLKFKNKFNSLLFITATSPKLIFLKPQLYMNLSGQAVNAVKQFYKIDNKNIVVIYDDKDLVCGSLRIKDKGKSGGHNGIKNIISFIKEDFLRIKIGIGNNTNYNSVDWVLGKITKDEWNSISPLFQDIYNLINDLYWNNKTLEFIKNYYNKRIKIN